MSEGDGERGRSGESETRQGAITPVPKAWQNVVMAFDWLYRGYSRQQQKKIPDPQAASLKNPHHQDV